MRKLTRMEVSHVLLLAQKRMLGSSPYYKGNKWITPIMGLYLAVWMMAARDYLMGIDTDGTAALYLNNDNNDLEKIGLSPVNSRRDLNIIVEHVRKNGIQRD